ncbi:GNAT family N-acetyltransferase [Xylophilus sp. ASV27]|uniref:GNAT family N-acetyltransferase n=1 Tax=Xylophilus sp. ASV27 TaxID=2795129 RepID=UPI001E2F98CA|nr:GNAT family N-acetyltransferase [Xylophilus sp. ASV27]
MTNAHMPMDIRRAVPADAQAISALILSLAHHFLARVDGAGADAFLAALQPAGIERNLGNKELEYYVGMAAGALAGVVAVRRGTHLFHLFVDPAFQRRGVARALWTHVATAQGWRGASAAVTVNSTPFAQPFYESVGFRAAGPRVETNGIAFIPMRLVPA